MAQVFCTEDFKSPAPSLHYSDRAKWNEKKTKRKKPHEMLGCLSKRDGHTLCLPVSTRTTDELTKYSIFGLFVSCLLFCSKLLFEFCQMYGKKKKNSYRVWSFKDEFMKAICLTIKQEHLWNSIVFVN